MRRREFLSGAMTVPLLAQAGKNMSASLPNARWLESGLIDAGGSHEGYLFVTRRGGERLDTHDAYERTQSEELIVRLKSQGIEVFHTHLYKGFGMAVEKPEMEDARRVAAIAHRRLPPNGRACGASVRARS